MADTKDSGQIFVAYRGNEIEKTEIEKALDKKCPKGYCVNSVTRTDGSILFVKIVCNEYMRDREPCLERNVVTVSGYNQDEIRHASNIFTNIIISRPSLYHHIIKGMFDYKGFEMFEMFGKNNIHICSVIYDLDNDLLVAGVTEPNSEYTHLYYGYTGQNHEIMFSNDVAILEQFCDEVMELPKNTYMKDSTIYNFDGEEMENVHEEVVAEPLIENSEEKVSSGSLIEDGKEVAVSEPLIKKNEENANVLIDGLNALITQVIDEKVRAKIGQNVDDYFGSEDSKKRISDFILNELDSETQKQVLMRIKKVMEELDLENSILDK